MKISRKIRKKLKQNAMIILLGISVITFITISIVYNHYNTSKTYTVESGNVEKVSNSYAYILKGEKVLEVDNTNAAIPVIEQDKRASKNEVIAVYKNSNYDDYQAQIAELDGQIETLVNDLPSMYSTDVNTINSQISKLLKEAQNETSYVKMQEYKSNINNLLSKKISLMGSLSPTGSKLRELIEEREKLESVSKNSNNNIKATMAGIVSYKLDGLESEIDINEVESYDESKFEEIISKYSNNNTNNFGIKIIDNYSCYYIVKEKTSENEQYMVEGNKYRVKLLNLNSSNMPYATLIKSIKKDDTIYNLFKIDNGIENIVDVREVAVEIIWKEETGLVVPLSLIHKRGDISYVTLITSGQYVEVPVKLGLSNDTISVISNYTFEEKQNLGIESNYIISNYDRLLMPEIDGE